MKSSRGPETIAGDTLHAALRDWAERTPDAPALLAPGRPPLSYAELWAQVSTHAAMLRAMGIGATDRVAIVLPQGPELPLAVLAVAAVAAAVPFNPAATEQDFSAVFEFLAPRVLMVARGDRTVARAAAAARGIPILELEQATTGPAGSFALRADGNAPVTSPAGEPVFNGPDNVAIVLSTSGTTSRAKFVPLTHRNVRTAAENTRDAFRADSNDRCLVAATLYHAHGLVAGVMSTLVAGAAAICPPGFVPEVFFACLEEFEPTWYTAVPTVHQGILQAAPRFPGQVARARLRAVRSASAYLSDALRAGIETLFRTVVVEGYGLTEAMQLTNTPLDAQRRKIGSLGITGSSQVAIMAEDGRLLGPGETGEIVARGPVVMSGYIDQPEANAAAFRAGWFRSGDYGHLDEDGHLYMTGRIKDQINRGGEKISPQEIDEVLMQMPAVAQALAFGVEHPTLGEDVAAAVVLRTGEQASVQDIQRFLAGRLPEHKVPRKVHIVPAIPQNTTGKLLRRAIAEQLKGLDLRPTYEAPRTEREQVLARLWEEVLGTSPIGIHDNFFELGGQSLLAAQLLARIRREFQQQVSMRLLFERPTISQLGQALAAEGHEEQIIIPRVTRGGALPLSFAQQRLWFLEQMEPGSTAYCMPEVFNLVGRVDVDALRRALEMLVDRHESLRTRFGERDGEPVQWIEARVETPFVHHELARPPAARSQETLDGIIQRELSTPFDLGRAPLIRLVLITLGEDQHVLVLNMHHIISDGWSKVILTRELSAIYAALLRDTAPALPPLDLQYVDYASWQRDTLAGPRLERQLAFWREHLQGAPELTELPTDKPRPPVMRDEGRRIDFRLPASLARALDDLCRSEGVTRFQLLLATFHVFLSRYTRQVDIVTGSPVAGREQTEFEPLVGFFVNTLALRSQPDPESDFRGFLAQVREITLAAYQHQEVPFEKVVEALQPQRSRAYSPLFQVMFILQNNAPRSLTLPGAEITPRAADRFVTKFDLTLSLEERDDGLAGYFEYRSDLFDSPTMARMARNYETLLSGIVAAPRAQLRELPLVSAAEESVLLGEWAQPMDSLPPTGLLHGLFEQQAAKTPDAPAVTFKGRSLSYAELDARANQLAWHLVGMGVTPDTRVALVMERSLELVVAILGVLKAGGAWVPIDPGYPAERIGWMLADSRAPILVTQSSLVETLPDTAARILRVEELETLVAHHPETPPPTAVTPDDLAYVIYTSGTTGRPKGAMLPHRGVHSRMLWQREGCEIGPGDVFMQKASISFDVSVWETFVPLVSGARLVLAEQSGQMDPQYLVALIEEQGITSIQFVPSMLRLFLDALPAGGCAALRQVFSGGEALSMELQHRFFDSHPARLRNFYGPTETSGAVTRWDCTPDVSRHTVPIGRPVPFTHAYVLDEHRNVVPIGVPGQLWIGGVQVGRGYLNREDLTAERFLPDPFSARPGSRMYATGDLVRWLNDGTIEFLGRLDNQVKLHGVRIELGEVEAAVTEYLEGRTVAVLGRDRDAQIVSGGSIEQLVAFVVADAPIDVASTRNGLLQSLPASLVPSSFIAVDRLPLTPNGKLDRRALMELKQDAEGSTSRYAPPETELQSVLVVAWEEILGRSPIGIDDDYFDLGGHSLLAIRLFGRIRAVLAQQKEIGRIHDSSGIAPNMLWAASTIRGLAGMIERGAQIPTPRDGAKVRFGERSGRAPLFLFTGVLHGEAFFPRRFAKTLGPGQQIIAIAPHDVTQEGAPRTIQEMAARFLEDIRSEQPQGPYLLAGYSHSGLIVYEMARELEKQGEQVGLAFIIDTPMPAPWLSKLRDVVDKAGDLFSWNNESRDDRFLAWRYRALHAKSLWKSGLSAMLRYYASRLKRRVTASGRRDLEAEVDPQDLLDSFNRTYLRAVNLYAPRASIMCPVVLISAMEGPAARLGDPMLGWGRVCTNLDVHRVPGEHSSCLAEHVDEVGKILAASIPNTSATNHHSSLGHQTK